MGSYSILTWLLAGVGGAGASLDCPNGFLPRLDAQRVYCWIGKNNKQRGGSLPARLVAPNRQLRTRYGLAKSRAYQDAADDVSTLVGLRDPALIALMTYGFARVSAAVATDVEDYRPKGKRWWVRLHEKRRTSRAASPP